MRRMTRLVFATAAGVALFNIAGCPIFQQQNTGDNGNTDGTNNGGTDNNGGTTDDGGSDSSFSVTKTDISVHVQGGLEVGDDVIAFGTGGSTGVDWILASGNDSAGRGIPGASSFRSTGFVVANTQIAMTDSNFQVTVFNTETGDVTPVSLDDVRLARIPVGAREAGHMQASGNYIATINEESDVVDGAIIKVIDVSSGLPSVISFTSNPTSAAEQIQMVAVNGETGLVVAASSTSFFVYDISNPTAPPIEYEADSNGIGDAQMAFDGANVIFHDDASQPNAMVLNVGSGTFTTLTSGPAAGEVAIGDGSFGYFTTESVGSNLQSAIGTLPSAAPTLGVEDSFIDGSTTNNGFFGFGQTIGVNPDGGEWWMAGSESVGSGEYLQYSTGGTFATIADPTNTDEFGCPATDVRVSANVVAFKVGSGSDTVLAYIPLTAGTGGTSVSRTSSVVATNP